MPEIGEKERNYLFRSYIDLEAWLNVFIKILKSFRIPTDAHSPSFSLCPVPGSIYQEKKYKSMIPAPSNINCVSTTRCPLCQNPVSDPLFGMAAGPGFKSPCQSSSAAPFPTPPTISYTCQHSRILLALLGCHSKSGQVWPHGVEPIFSKLSCRHCNQGELLPSYILGGRHSQPPDSKHGHSYLTYLWKQLKVIDMLNDPARG